MNVLMLAVALLVFRDIQHDLQLLKREAPVTFHAEGDVPWRALADVIALCSRAGIRNIRLSDVAGVHSPPTSTKRGDPTH